MTEKHSPHSPSRLGVVFCQCGGEISGRLDLEALRQEVILTSTPFSIPASTGARRISRPSKPQPKAEVWISRA